MVVKSKRRHQRIPYSGKVDLLFDDIEYLGCAAQNLSLIGVLVEGCQEKSEGTLCDIQFHDSLNNSSRPIRIKGEVVRVDDRGVALLFLNLNVRTYTDLESLISDHGREMLVDEDTFLEELQAQQ